jgi:hypothetical protein
VISLNENTIIGIVIGAGLAIMIGLGVDKKHYHSFATKTHKSNIHKGNPAHHFHGPASEHNKDQSIQNSELLTPSQEAAKLKAQFLKKSGGKPSIILNNPTNINSINGIPLNKGGELATDDHGNLAPHLHDSDHILRKGPIIFDPIHTSHPLPNLADPPLQSRISIT